MRGGLMFGMKKTREQWLAECIWPWRVLMDSIQQTVPEVAQEAGVSEATVAKMIRGDGNPGAYRNDRDVIAAIFRLRGVQVAREDVSTEAMHIYQATIGVEPHIFGRDRKELGSKVVLDGNAARDTRRCRLCNPERARSIQAAMKRQAAAAVKLRALRHKLGLAPDEWLAVCHAVADPSSYRARDLVAAMNEMGQPALAAIVSGTA